MSETSETKYWRCKRNICSRPVFIEGAVYEQESHGLRIVDSEGACWLNTGVEGGFTPWIPAPGDWVIAGKSMFTNINGKEAIVERAHPAGDAWSIKIGETTYSWMELKELHPVLHRAPAPPAPAPVASDEIAVGDVWVWGDAQKRVLVTGIKTNGTPASTSIRCKPDGSDSDFGYGRAYFLENFRKISGGASTECRTATVNTPSEADTSPAAAQPSYIGASARHTAAMLERQRVAAKIAKEREEDGCETLGDTMARDIRETVISHTTRLRAELAALEPSKPMPKRVDPQPVRCGIWSREI